MGITGYKPWDSPYRPRDPQRGHPQATPQVGSDGQRPLIYEEVKAYGVANNIDWRQRPDFRVTRAMAAALGRKTDSVRRAARKLHLEALGEK